MSINNLLAKKQSGFSAQKGEVLTVAEYLEQGKNSPQSVYPSVHRRILTAIGEPTKINSSNDARLEIIHGPNVTVNRYPAFSEFYGMESTIQQIVDYLVHADLGLEERKQILYLLGPVGSAKSSLAEKIKELVTAHPYYIVGVMVDGTFVPSPSFDNPLCLFNKDDAADLAEYKITPAMLRRRIPSPWVTKRLTQFGGDISQFRVQKVYPSILESRGICKTEPGDENNQDISALVGKVDIRKLEHFAQNDADALSYSGALTRANQGVMEFVEMFKAPLKVLHPLLTATQEGNFNTTEEGVAALPFEGLILAHSNESEWQSFRNNKNNEAFLDRVCIVKVPYCLRVSEEVKIYKKLLSESELAGCVVAPQTLESLAQLSVLSRLEEPENSSVYSKMRVYDGENLRDEAVSAKSHREYKDGSSLDEGMSGLSTRFAFKIISQVATMTDEHALNPVHLFNVAEQSIINAQLPAEETSGYISHLKGYIIPQYQKFLQKEIQEAYLQNGDELCQNKFDRYVLYADCWVQGTAYRDPQSGLSLDTEKLGAELESYEKPAGISNPKDFRNEVVNFVLRHKSQNNGQAPSWKANQKMAKVIQRQVLASMDEILPIISFGEALQTDKQKASRESFVQAFVAKGYTESQVRFLCEWYLHNRVSK